MKDSFVCLFLIFLAQGILVGQQELRGYVLNGFDQPLANVEVRLPYYKIAGTTTDNNGLFIFKIDGININSGDSILFRLLKEGYIPSPAWYMSETGTPNSLTFRLFEEKLNSINGRLKDPNGFPLQDFMVELPDYNLQLAPRVKTDKFGNFNIDVSNKNIRIKIGQEIRLEIFDEKTNRALSIYNISPNQYGKIPDIIFDKCEGQIGKDCDGIDSIQNIPYRGIRDANCDCIPKIVKEKDFDLDGKINRIDRCPCEYGENRSGCPGAPLKLPSRLLPGLYDQEYLIFSGWVASTSFTIYGFNRLHKINEGLAQAVTINQRKIYEDKRTRWRIYTAIGASVVLATYVLDNLNLTKDDHCLSLSKVDNAVGFSYTYNF